MKKIEARQKDVIEGKVFFPIVLYPEGTTTNGRCLINFKKGAFYSLSPVKPLILKLDNSENTFSLGTGGMNILLHISIAFTFPYLKVGGMELPVFAPNDYLFNNFSHLGKDKPEIFSEAVRDIMSVVGKLPKINNTFDTKLNYMSLIKGKVIKNT